MFDDANISKKPLKGINNWVIFPFRVYFFNFAFRLKTIIHYINVVIWVLVGLYLALAILINIPVVQSSIGDQVATALSHKLNTKVHVGRVDLGLFNRIIIDDVHLLDQKGKPLLRATRLSAKFDYIELIRGRVSISSAQLFGLNANLYKETADAKPNFQFVLDSLASKDTTQHRPLDITLRSLIIRHGELSYNQLDQPRKSSFDMKHLHVKNLSSHILLNALRDDSLNLYVKRLSLNEQAGLNIRSFTFKLAANKTHAALTDLDLQLPASRLSLGDINASYRLQDGKLTPGSLNYTGSILPSSILPNDILALVPKARKFSKPVLVRSSFSGTDHTLSLQRFEASMPKSLQHQTFSAPADFHVSLSGELNKIGSTLQWMINISELTVDRDGMGLLASDIPDIVGRMQYFSYRGKASGQGRAFSTKGTLQSGTGNADVDFAMNNGKFIGHVATNGFDLRQLLNNDQFGKLITDINVSGNINHKFYKAQGTITDIDFNGYNYQNINLDGTFNRGLLDGTLSIDDPNLAADIKGSLNTNTHSTAANLTATISHFMPSALHLLKKQLGEASYTANIAASFTGRDLNSVVGHVNVDQLTKTSEKGQYTLDSLRLRAGNNREGHYLTLNSDFADVSLSGRFDYSTLIQTLKNAVASKLPSIQQLTNIRYHRTVGNDFSLRGTVTRTDWLREFFGANITLTQPLNLSASTSQNGRKVEANIFAPKIVYNNSIYKDVSVMVSSPDDQLNADISMVKVGSNGIGTDYRFEASAKDDQLTSVLTLDNHAAIQRLKGRLNSMVTFHRGNNSMAEAHINISPSEVSIGDSTFTIHPSNVVYSKDHLEVNDFFVSGGNQRISINGVTSKSTSDSLQVDLDHVNVAYLLNLVNFRAVKFSGHASGRAYLSNLFGTPDAQGNLDVEDFHFQDGRMGTLHALVDWNRAQEQIDIDAQAIDTLTLADHTTQPRTTMIVGYVSPKRNYIDLAIHANNTRGEFVESFCSTFMDHTNITANGMVRLWGDLKKLNLTGQLVVDGSLRLTPLNTEYKLRRDTIRCLVDEIRFGGDSIYDRNGNIGMVSGSLYHKNLTNLSYAIRTQANNLLAYDWGPTYGNTFYGTVYGTGYVDVKGSGGDVYIDVNITPERGSQIVYDISSPEVINKHDFIHWSSPNNVVANSLVTNITQATQKNGNGTSNGAVNSSDIHINFLINATPDATLKILMDRRSGDYISLNGSGALRASFYNRGELNIFGNYLIDHGVYKLTIQNFIKRDFTFTQGGSIAFGGNPEAARLDLNAQYTVNSVSLSDLQIGRNFTSNNIRVDCLMNITGTPLAPKIDFSLDLPTVTTDAKQMIYSLINSEEEMNQQVLYLLAVGRFYAQPTNNASSGSTSNNQTNLAMQSILSGQISQQINTLLGSMVKNNNWNFGANISTGAEGWNNAEYEGLLSGRLLNNRLLVDGQFGYRDNNRATTSFIGDFDLRYLITPNGNLSIHVYNQTSDRYFTRNSLATQGIGFIVKKDFENWKSLFGIRQKQKKQTASPSSAK